MSDVQRPELQWMLEALTKYLNKNRNHLAQDLYRQMHRDDCLGDYGHICCHNEEFDLDIKVTYRKKRSND